MIAIEGYLLLDASLIGNAVEVDRSHQSGLQEAGRIFFATNEASHGGCE